MVETGVNATGGHIWFLLGALGFAAICALILSDRWHSLSPLKVKIAAGLAALSGCAHIVAARVGSDSFQLSWLFGGVGLLLAVGWYLLGARLGSSPRLVPAAKILPAPTVAPAPASELLSQNTQRSLAAASTALAFASALAVYMSRIV